MRKKMRTNVRRRRVRRRGAMLAIIPVVLVLFIILAAFVIDLGYIFVNRSRLQSAADAASLAGCLRLRANAEATYEVRQLAIRFAELNQPGTSGVLGSSDIQIGQWDDERRSFHPGGEEVNAVEVTVRRGQQGVPGVALFFSRAIGAPDAQMSTTSVAAFESSEDEEGNTIKTMPRIVQ